MNPLLSALFGGLIIGLNATGVQLAFGRRAGISGMVAGSMFGQPGEGRWRTWFLVGLVAAISFGGTLILQLLVARIGQGWPQTRRLSALATTYSSWRPTGYTAPTLAWAIRFWACRPWRRSLVVGF